MQNKVLLIGWDAADWKVIHPLMDAGKMPALKRMVDGGTMGNMCTLHPVLSPMLWTSIATGKRPFKHGIHGFCEPSADGSSIQPITNLSRKTKAVWNILNQNELRSIVVGWWPSHPAEPINGAMVSNHFQAVHGVPDPANTTKPYPDGTVHPPELESQIADLRIEPTDLEGSDIQLFIPRANEIDVKKDRRLYSFSKVFCETATIQAVATHLMETQKWDFAAIYFDAIDHFSHGFMKYHPPRQPNIKEEDFELYKDVVASGYVYHDMMLARLLELAGDETTVILISDHGFHPDHLRPKILPNEPAGPAIEHRDFGIFAMTGPRIKRDLLVHGVNLLDVTPTVLQLFDLAIGDDMDGRVITEAFVDPPQVNAIPSWDEVDGNDGRHSGDRKIELPNGQDALDQLVELGYIDPLATNQNKNVNNAKRELDYNLARSYMDADYFGQAAPILARLLASDPGEYRFGIQLAMCLKAFNRVNELSVLVDQMIERRRSEANVANTMLSQWRAYAGGLELQTASIEKDVDDSSPAATNGAEQDETQPWTSKLSDGQKSKVRQLLARARVHPYSLEFLKGYALFAQGDTESSIEYLQLAIKAQPQRPGLHIQIGEAFLQLNRTKDAQLAFQKGLAIDENNAHLLLGMSQCHLRLKEFDCATRYALQSIARVYQHANAHYFLGLALVGLKRPKKAVVAFENATIQNPNFVAAHRQLVALTERLGNLEQSAYHRSTANELESKQLSVSTPKEQQFEIPNVSSLGAPIDLGQYAAPKPSDAYQPALADGPRRIVKDVYDKADHKKSLIIVSGLPRSGTSMMMQALVQGGVSPIEDNHRVADQSNPRGYLEFERTKRLANDNSWIQDQLGCAIKVIAQLIPHLPWQHDYKVIFMDRDLDEIVLSQNKMLARTELSDSDRDCRNLKPAFRQHAIAAMRMLSANGVPTMIVSFKQTVEQPDEAMRRVAEFLKIQLDIEAMVAAISPSLHRTVASTMSENNSLRDVD